MQRMLDRLGEQQLFYGGSGRSREFLFKRTAAQQYRRYEQCTDRVSTSHLTLKRSQWVRVSYANSLVDGKTKISVELMTIRWQGKPCDAVFFHVSRDLVHLGYLVSLTCLVHLVGERNKQVNLPVLPPSHTAIDQANQKSGLPRPTLTHSSWLHNVRWSFHRSSDSRWNVGRDSVHLQKEARAMRFIKVKDEERTGEVAINLDLVREAHFGGGLLHLYFERSATTQDDMTFTGENAQKIWAAMG
jgi:hypothetical protein